ncbi:hypothetical protein LXA43DRAFT_1184274 [Ganoderma leucocontextum]|nr:hypothetical protein LXA43DRAFT_1184274 [Ganoderma leucocontextum]
MAHQPWRRLGNIRFTHDETIRRLPSELQSPEADSGTRCTTCRAFAEPASRVLWEVQHGLGPIVSLLKNAQGSDEDDNALDWMRFEHIARRIRVLFCGEGLNCDVDIIALICARYDGRPIFPNLRALFCGVQPLGVALLTGLCASPALVLVNTLECNPTVVDSLVVVSDARPEIGHLHALCLTRFDEDSHRALAKFHNLQSARFGLIDNALFCHLGTLPNLQIDGGGFRAALPFISSKSLAILSLRIEVELTEEMQEFLDEICASPALAHLSELDFAVHIGFNQWDNQEEPFEGVSLADALPSLQRLRELKVITILVEDLNAIASTWPDLVSLKVGHFIEHDDWPGGPEGIGRPSLSAVVALAERCRKLEELDVEFESVDVRELERLEARAAACAAPQTELRQIVVGPGCTDFCQKLRLADPTRVVAALRKLFPNVVSGLEMLGGGTEEGSAEALRYRGWHPEDIETDMFRLLKGLDLEDVQLDGAVIDRDDFQAFKVKRLTLARAARTCKAFADPASRVLWEVLVDPAPIVSVLRTLNAHAASEAEENARIWDRFEQIARRIRAFCCWTSTGHGDEDIDILPPICSHYDGHPIFPNLRVLSVGAGVHGAPWLAFLRAVCASPTLVLCTIAAGYDIAVPESLAIISDAHPELPHLKAPSLWRFDEESHRALAKFSNLQTARFMFIDTTLFSHLAALPNLRMLRGRFAISKPTMDIQSAFPALRELSTEDMDARTECLAVLPLISSKSLARLSVQISVPLTESMLEYLDEMCSSPALAQLHELDLRVDIEFNQFENQDEPFEGVRVADVLAPLKRLPALRDILVVVNFRTSTVAAFDMNDKDLDTVASAWPDLAHVKLGHAIEHDDSPGGQEGIGRPSLSAVVSLAERCRKLESLEVEFESVDASELARLEARADACASPQTELRRIVFDPVTDFRQKLRVADPSRLAAALRKMFPNLTSGLEMLQEETRAGSVSLYRGWYLDEMKTDEFRLLKALDDLHLDGQV